MTTSEKDCYEILGVSPTAGQDEIRRAYRMLVRRYHPDSGTEESSAQRFQEVHAAYETLGDPLRRQAYDRQRAEKAADADTTFMWNVSVSSEYLQVLNEEQLLYVLVDIYPGRRARGQRLPINLAIVIDRSTSMQGNRLDYVKAAAHQIVDEMEEHDSISVVTFSDRAEVVVPAQNVIDRARIHGRISGIWTSGGTEILQGFTTGLEQIRQANRPNVLSHLLLLTDGQTYGDEEECIAESRRAGLERICVSTLGIGEDWNDALLEEMARQTNGACFYISHPSHLRRVLREYIQGLSGIVARELRLTTRLVDGVGLLNAFRTSPSIDRLLPKMDEIELGLLRQNDRLQVLLELIVDHFPVGARRLVQLELAGIDPATNQRQRLIRDLSTEFTNRPQDGPVPTPIVNVVNRVNLFRMQEMAWHALSIGDSENARRKLEAIATRLLDMGERDLARVALLEAGRVNQGKQISGKGQKTIKFGTRSLGMKGL